MVQMVLLCVERIGAREGLGFTTQACLPVISVSTKTINFGVANLQHVLHANQTYPP